MGDIVVRDLNDGAHAVLQARARERGVAVDALVREIVEADVLHAPTPLKPEPPVLTEAERAERRRLAARIAEIRARTIKPLWSDSTLLIREDRNTR